MFVLLTLVEPMLYVYQRTREPSVPVLQALDQILMLKWLVPPSMLATTILVTDLASVDLQPLVSVASVHKDKLVIHTKLAVSQKEAVLMEIKIVLIRVSVSLADARTFAMMDVDLTQNVA